MCEHCSSGEAIVDAAIEEGRIDLESRDTFLRAFAAEPDLVVGVLENAKPGHAGGGRKGGEFRCLNESGGEPSFTAVGLLSPVSRSG